MVATLVDKSAVIQDGYSNCTDEKIKEKLAMECHTTGRSFDQFVFCCAGDKEEWNTTVEQKFRSCGPPRSVSFRILKTHICFKSRSPITRSY
jgi:hypothetical protein